MGRVGRYHRSPLDTCWPGPCAIRIWREGPGRGPVILSGDMVHLRDNWEQRRVPTFNFDREQSLQSMEKIAALMKQTGAQLWINHDKAQSDSIPKAPAYIE